LNYERLESKIGYVFTDKSILNKALTHASKSQSHLERQEFLGDAVLGLSIAEYLYQQYPDVAEGDLSKMRANLVCKTALLDIAKAWQLSKYLNVGDGERTAKGELKSQSIAANAVEAVIGAVFLDAGWETAKQVLLKAWADLIEQVEPIDLRDAKSELQELTQANRLGLPTYIITDLGVQKSPRFQAECLLNQLRLGMGRGERKKTAELNAAKEALLGKALIQLLDTDS